MTRGRRIGTWAAIAAVLLTLASGVSGQAASPRGLVLGLTGLYHGQQDLTASPLHYIGGGWEASLAWRRPGPVSRLSLVASFGTGTLASDLTDGPVHAEELLVARLGARYVHVVGSLAGDRVLILAGGDVTGHALGRFHRYVQDTSAEVFADLLAPLSVVGGWEWTVAEVRVGQRLMVPVAGITVRTPYSGLKYAPTVGVGGPSSITGFGHELFVGTTAGGIVDVEAGWSLTSLHHDDPRPIDLATHRFTLSLSLHRRGAR